MTNKNTRRPCNREEYGTLYMNSSLVQSVTSHFMSISWVYRDTNSQGTNGILWEINDDILDEG